MAKMVFIRRKIFLIFAQNIDCGETLEPPLMSTKDLCFRTKTRKNVYAWKPQFYYINVGYKVVQIIRTFYHNAVPLICDYIKKYSRPIGLLYFYRPINIILSADWSDYIKDKTRRLPKSVPKLYNRPIVGRRPADTTADEKWRATIGRSSADDRPTVGQHIGR